MLRNAFIVFVIPVFLFSMVWAKPEAGTFDTWSAARDQTERAGLGKSAPEYFSPAFLSDIEWPERGRTVEGWLHHPLFLIYDLHQWKEKQVDDHACLLLNGYTSNGRPATVSLRFVRSRDGRRWLIDRYASRSSWEDHRFPERALCPRELEAWPPDRKAQDGLVE